MSALMTKGLSAALPNVHTTSGVTSLVVTVQTNTAAITTTTSDCARHFSNWCDICKAAKVVYGNRSDNHCNQSDTQSSILLLLVLELY